MDNREVEKLWDRQTADVPRPRRPNPNSGSGQAAPVQPPPQQHREDADLSILTKTSLRVDAKEWFPPSHPTPVVPQGSVQNRLKNIKDNSAPPEGAHGNPEEYEDIGLDTSRLYEIIKLLTYDPGHFDHAVETFMGLLAPFLEDIEVVSIAAEMIFNQALCEPSFRYNAARLCTVIDDHCPLFRGNLHLLCEKGLQSSHSHKQGLTLFLAELYMQLHYENIYGKSLLTALKILIGLRTPDDVKCICHTLKLAGGSLDLYKKEALDTIFNQLEVIRSSGNVSGLNGLLDSVFELRKSQWGHITPSTSINSSCPPEQNGFFSSSDDGVVLYGPDGQEITTEEREFLQANFEDPNDYLGDESSDPDELFDPEPEMDEEIQAAFREFIKMSKR